MRSNTIIKEAVNEFFKTSQKILNKVSCKIVLYEGWTNYSSERFTRDRLLVEFLKGGISYIECQFT